MGQHISKLVCRNEVKVDQHISTSITRPQHKINHRPRHRHIQPNGKHPPCHPPMSLHLTGKTPDKGEQNKRKYSSRQHDMGNQKKEIHLSDKSLFAVKRLRRSEMIDDIRHQKQKRKQQGSINHPLVRSNVFLLHKIKSKQQTNGRSDIQRCMYRR